MNRTKTRTIAQYVKIAVYSGVALALTASMAYATLDEQVSRASNIVLGNLASLVVGGGTAVGGGVAVFQGNIMKALGIVGVGATIGIGIALAKNGVIFNLLQ